LCNQSANHGKTREIVLIPDDGYRLTYGGLDYLALKSFSRRKPATCAAVGKKIGVGKESDVYVVEDEGGERRILKLERYVRILLLMNLANLSNSAPFHREDLSPYITWCSWDYGQS
jgi:hypothetical protein